MKKLLTLFTVALISASMWATDGALSGRFTINANGDQVVFSQGNLQATTTNLGETWNWAFAEHQWDYIGNAVANNAINGNGTVSTNGTVDLFGWSTDATYYGIHNSIMYTDYAGNFVDWGNNMVDNWRTLSADEWSYLFSTRTNAQQLRGQATVNGIHGYIFLPDDWSIPSGLSFQGSPNNWTSNQYAGDDWAQMETAGAVFLPTAGSAYQHDGKYIKEVDLVSSYGYYWSSSPYSQGSSYYWYFREDLAKMNEYSITQGHSVRLIQDVTPTQPAWVQPGDEWDAETKTLTVNSNPGERAYYENSKIEHIIISDGVTSIGEYAFYNCVSVTSVEFPNSVESISDYAFSYCISLTSAMIPNSVTSMGNSAFEQCYHMTSLTIGNSVQSIGERAFFGCSELTAIDIPNSVTSIGGAAFDYCEGLTSVTIGDGVVSIGESAFKNCIALTSVTIGNGVTSIGYNAFEKCTALTSVSIGNSVTSIGNYAFYECAALTSVEIPNSVEIIGMSAFSYCTALTSVTIGTGITLIDNSAFYGCPVLTSVTCQAVTPPTIGFVLFTECPELAHIYVPAESVDAYKTATNWSAYETIIEAIPDQEGIDQITNDQLQITNKVIQDGQLLILRESKTYTMTGQELK